MINEKSVYTFQFVCNPVIVNNIVQNYLKNNKFKFVNKGGKRYYKTSRFTFIEANWYFDYSITGQTLTIYAWFNTGLGTTPLETNMLSSKYSESLSELFHAIETINNSNRTMNSNNSQMNYDPYTGKPINNNYQQVSQQNNVFSQELKEKNAKRNTTLCEIGFWLSLASLVLLIFGIARFGLVGYLFIFAFLVQGLKTRKRGKAIIGLIISVISLLISLWLFWMSL